MPDPVTLSAASIGGAALSEGIKFLYNQAGEVIKRWREQKCKTSQSVDQPEAMNLILPKAAFEGNLKNVTINFEKAQQSEGRLRQLREKLLHYVDGTDEVNESDTELLRKIDELRSILEAIYKQHITFKGENRQVSGTPVIVGDINANEVDGEAIGVEAKAATGGEVRGSVKANQVKKGGKVIGVKMDTIGGKSS